MPRFHTPLAAVFVSVFVAAALTPVASAQKSQSSALINEALDKNVTLDLNTALPEAMRTIAKQTGVRIEAAPAVWDLLPWGEQTNITAKIENVTLRNALEAITRKLGLEFALKDEAVELRPMPALARLGRRSTVQELQALDMLASTPAALGSDRPTVRLLIEAIDQKLVDLKSPFAIESRPGDNVTQEQAVSVPRNATLMEALEALSAQTRATWYPWGKSIVIVPKEDQVRNQLAKTVSVRYPGTDIAQVLTELSQKAGVQFEIEPGAIQRIAPEFRRIKLDLYDASITKALEAIAGFTGLGYVVNERGVYLWNAAGGGASTTQRDPVIAIIQLDNGTQIMLPTSQVPPDVLEYLRTRQKREVEKIRKLMKEEGFKPSAAPTTKPTTKPDEDL